MPQVSAAIVDTLQGKVAQIKLDGRLDPGYDEVGGLALRLLDHLEPIEIGIQPRARCLDRLFIIDVMAADPRDQQTQSGIIPDMLRG